MLYLIALCSVPLEDISPTDGLLVVSVVALHDEDAGNPTGEPCYTIEDRSTRLVRPRMGRLEVTWLEGSRLRVVMREDRLGKWHEESWETIPRLRLVGSRYDLPAK